MHSLVSLWFSDNLEADRRVGEQSCTSALPSLILHGISCKVAHRTSGTVPCATLSGSSRSGWEERQTSRENPGAEEAYTCYSPICRANVSYHCHHCCHCCACIAAPLRGSCIALSENHWSNLGVDNVHLSAGFRP